MNWNRFITNNISYEKAFETLCNQLFENWIKEKYVNEVKLFRTVNGSGGDGGIESYAILKSEQCIGMQAKWFITAMDKSQISQIENSIRTAKKVRPEITKYIVCIPRNLSPKKVNTKNAEEQKWDYLVESIKKDFVDLEIELWDDQKLLTEIQKPQCIGIYKYWFENTDLFIDNINDSFLRAKDSWLKTKYVPELHLSGVIDNKVSKMLGTVQNKKILLDQIKTHRCLCQNLLENTEQLIDVLDDKLAEVINVLDNFINELKIINLKNEELIEYIVNEQEQTIVFDGDIYYINFRKIESLLNEHKNTYNLYSHFNDVISDLDDLYDFDIEGMIREINEMLNRRPILFLGEPGTGKTHGIASITEKILKEGYHIPILIESKSIANDETWQNIIIKNLRLSSKWDEAELWQALSTLAYRNRMNNIGKEISILPKVLIIVDAIDESRDYDVWKRRIQETNAILKKYPMFRFVFTSRPFVFANDIITKEINCVNLNSNGDVNTFVLYDKYISFYNVRVLNNNLIKYSLNTPLALKLFCELNKNQIIDTTNIENITLSVLIKTKIEKIEKEFSKTFNHSEKNQYIFRTIKVLSFLFKNANELKWDESLAKLTNELNINRIYAENILTFLIDYGIIGSYCIKGTTVLDEDENYLFIGIQGYFDYITAEIILQECKHPAEIDFNNYIEMDKNVLYSLALLSIQRYDYLLTRNTTISAIISEYEIEKLQFFALRKTNLENGKLFIDRTKEIMKTNSDGLFTIVNELVLPLSRSTNHPLGISILDECLSIFESPAQRDLIWSYYGYIKAKKEDKWYRFSELELDNPEFDLNSDDSYAELPTFYAWTLSGLNNKIREKCRNKLLKWAISAPKEYIKLFYKFSNCNDPQIVEEMYSILMCCLFECMDRQLIKEIGDWIIENILNQNKIDINRNISIRYYCINILKKASWLEIYKKEYIDKFLPPYKLYTVNINLNIGALTGTRMSGYKCIDYDLSRYVLVDHFESYFRDYDKINEKINSFLKEFEKLNDSFKNLTLEKFILASAYQYILDMGWNEYDFSIYRKEKECYYGFDYEIRKIHYPASHGSKSNVMTVSEKYVWQARKMLSGFLSDRLPVRINNEWKKIEKYEMLDNFYVPSQDLNIINPHDIPLENTLYISELDKITFMDKKHSKQTLCNEILNSANIDCDTWLIIDNEKRKFKVEENKLITLYNFFNYIDKNGIDTIVSINSLIIEKSQVSNFIKKIKGYKHDKQNYLCPSEWSGYIESSCYITPKEVCWLPWINREEPYELNDLSDVNALATTDQCVYNNDYCGDVHYIIPSLYIRDLMKINNSNGYKYENENSEVVAEFYLSGKLHKTYQQILVMKEEVLEKLLNKNKVLVWLFREYRRESSKVKEKIGDFFAEKCIDYVVYYDGDKLIKEKVNEIKKSRLNE